MVIDGKKISQQIYAQLVARIAALPFQPIFCDVVVGADPVSLSYVKIKGQTAEKIGLKFIMKQFPADLRQEELLKEIAKLNSFPKLCGLIIQLPLPEQYNRDSVLNAIDPRLDVDCLGQKNTEAFYSGQPRLSPPTAAAVMQILDELNLGWQDKNFLVLGQGELVGKPVAYLLKARGLKATVADRLTHDLHSLIKQADVLISGTGQPGLVKGQDLKPGCVVIDAGTAETSGGIVGDVDFASVKTVAKYVSPVPGGVGPLTVAKLLENVVLVAEQTL